MGEEDRAEELSFERLRAASPREIVERVLARKPLIKVALSWLQERGRPADADAAARLVDAHARREAEPWVIAQLLARVPHPTGLTTAIALLVVDRDYADVSAAEAVTCMGDRSVAPTLEALLLTRTDIDARRGAARALGGLLGADAVLTLRRAFREGRILARTAGAALALAEVSDAVLATWLRSDATDRGLALEALHQRLAHIAWEKVHPQRFCFAAWHKGVTPSAELAPLVEDVLREAGAELLASERERITEWLDGAKAQTPAVHSGHG